MKQKLSGRDYTYVASMLFGMFFGAGNLIFPVHMGQMAGANVWPAVIGFCVTGVGLPLLGVAALGISRSGGLFELGSRVGKPYSMFFTCLLYLTIGPFFAIPRCVTTSFTVGLEQVLPQGGNTRLCLLAFSAAFFAAALFFSLRPGKILVWVGKVLNPCFLLFLGILVIVAMLRPGAAVGAVVPEGAYAAQPFFTGFLEGYNTMDTIAALNFGLVISATLGTFGLTEKTGIDLYGEKKLAALLRELCKLDFRWIRLHYLYPDEFTDELIDTIAAEEKVLPYLDIPIQHCNDKVLRAMNRRGDKAELLALFRKLRERIPDLVLRTSLITGLPFEDEAAFEELCEFLQEVRIERAGVFPYSPEEGTPAARMLNRVDTAEAERRAELVVDVQSRIMDDFNDSRMGTVAEVLCDGFDQEAMQFVGRSYAESPDIDGRIYFTADHEVEAGEFVPVRITGAMDGELTGELAE